jgi:hypothetical protein
VRRADDAVWFGRESVRWNPRRRSIRPADVRLAVPEAVERVERLSERAVQIVVLLGDLADLGDQQPDRGLADLLDRLAAAVDVTAQRFGTREGPAEVIAGSAAEVRRHRDPAIEPAQVRATCVVTVADALADLSPPGPEERGPGVTRDRSGSPHPCNEEATRTVSGATTSSPPY